MIKREKCLSFQALRYIKGIQFIVKLSCASGYELSCIQKRVASKVNDEVKWYISNKHVYSDEFKIFNQLEMYIPQI